MAIEFICPHCDKLLRTADDKAGVRASCPHCRGPIEIPDLADEPAGVDPDADPLGDFFGAPVGAPSGAPGAGSRPAGASAVRSGPAQVRCPACQVLLPSGSRTCRHCGATVSGTPPVQPFADAPPLRPHRGPLILTFGILGWLVFGCVPLSFSAALLGTQDLREMREGRMDPSGESMTQVGQVMGFIQLGLFAVSIVVIIISILA